jgi:hypothetical protein
MAKAPTPALGFFKSLPASVYSPAFYAGISKRSFWKGFWYMVGCTFLFLLLAALTYVIIPYTTHREQIDATIEKFTHVYPEELEIIIQDGQVTTNVEEPYFVSFQELFAEWEWAQNNPEVFEDVQNLIVIDTVTPYSTTQFLDYQTVAWLGLDALYVKDDNGIEAIPLADAKDVYINKEMADSAVDTIVTQAKAMLPFFAIFTFVAFLIGLVIFRMIYLMIFAVLMLICTSIMGVPNRFEDNYKIGFYAVTLPTFVSLFMPLVSGYLPIRIPFLFTLLALIVACVNLDRARRMNLLSAAKETKK